MALTVTGLHSREDIHQMAGDGVTEGQLNASLGENSPSMHVSESRTSHCASN